MTNRCPFCTNYAYAVSVGDAYQLDCRYCEIQIEITKRAYSARCPDPVGVLDFIREKLKVSTRPRVDLADMKRLRQPLAPRQEEEMTVTESDALTTAAKAIGTTLGKIAVRTGIAKPQATAPKARKKVAPVKRTVKSVAKKATKKTPAGRTAAGTKRKTVSKRSPSPGAKQRK